MDEVKTYVVFFHCCGNLKTALIESSPRLAKSSKCMKRYVKTPTIVSKVILSGSEMRENTYLIRWDAMRWHREDHNVTIFHWPGTTERKKLRSLEESFSFAKNLAIQWFLFAFVFFFFNSPVPLSVYQFTLPQYRVNSPYVPRFK